MQNNSNKNFPLHGWIGLVTLALSQTALVLRLEPVTTHFYSLIWWPYILTVDGLVYRLRGHSLIKNRKREFILLIPWSVALWLIFEAFNLVLRNWYYIGVPREMSLRWPGYFVAFGTVLPAVFETRELLDTWGVFKKSQVPEVRFSPQGHLLIILVGSTMLLLSLVWPLYAFPLVWGGFVFLLDPVNYRRGRSSLFEDLEQGSLTKFYQLLLAGLICGGLWEFWNYWATAKWIYTVPWVGEVKLFEMPVLGFLGFPPFAVECYVMAHYLRIYETDPARPNWSWKAVPLWAVLFAVMFWAIDQYTVRLYA
ncbi:MAG: hypothetical protein HY892_17460 [Deltaproteobacteria bacterium]|nr:hypothetical protein [Deltaproteobacteria bacterium]